MHYNSSQGVELSGFKLTCRFCRPNIMNVIKLPRGTPVHYAILVVQAESLVNTETFAVVCHSVVATGQKPIKQSSLVHQLLLVVCIFIIIYYTTYRGQLSFFVHLFFVSNYQVILSVCMFFDQVQLQQFPQQQQRDSESEAKFITHYALLDSCCTCVLVQTLQGLCELLQLPAAVTLPTNKMW